ncbi:GspH/FimT family pseudopilin [Pseudoxanthomonas mexicana]
MSERARPHARVEGGFTLIELVITLAVLAIIVTLALPAFTALINGNRLTAQANELVADLQSARMEAIKRNRPVTLCPSADNVTCSGGDWGNRIMMAPAGAGVEVIRISAAKGVLSVTGDAGSVVFRPDGFARAAAGGALLDAQFAVCLPTTAPANNVRQVTLAAGSRIATEPDSTAGVCP